MLRKIIQAPGLFVFLTELQCVLPAVSTDGRPLPKDPNPSWNGYSTGHWEGDTLVIETNGFQEGQWLDRAGSPLPKSAKIRRPNFGTLQMELNVDDPKAYTKLWSIQLSQSIILNTELLDYILSKRRREPLGRRTPAVPTRAPA